MKYLILLFCVFLVGATFADVQEYAKKHKIKCYGGDVGICTLIYCPCYVDENGEEQCGDCNTCCYYYNCGNKTFEVCN